MIVYIIMSLHAYLYCIPPRKPSSRGPNLAWLGFVSTFPASSPSSLPIINAHQELAAKSPSSCRQTDPILKMVADALVYHPTVAHYLRFVATTGTSHTLLHLTIEPPSSISCAIANAIFSTVGRDKLLRTLQYFSRFYAWYLFRTNNPARLIAPYEAIKKQFGLTRKALRLGKNVEHFKAAASAADSKNMDPVLKYCAVGRQLGYAMYLSLDAVTYVSAHGFRE